MFIDVDGGVPGLGEGQIGLSTDGVTTDIMLFDGGTFWVLPLTYFYLPKSARGYLLSPNLSRLFTFTAAPLVSTPFVCNQVAWPPERFGDGPPWAWLYY